MNRSCRPQATTQSWLTSTTTDSVIIFLRLRRQVGARGFKSTSDRQLFLCRIFSGSVSRACRELGRRLRLPYERAKRQRQREGARDMKYILLMSGSKAGVDAY